MYVSDSEMEETDKIIDVGLKHMDENYQTAINQDPLVDTVMYREELLLPTARLDVDCLDEYQPGFIATQQALSVPLQPAPINVEIPCNNGEVRNINGSALSTKRPRGRPKKNGLQQPPTTNVELRAPNNVMEAQLTWEMAKQLGVSSSNEEAVLTELRKSKRLLLLGTDAN
ncbi:unnamed protein product [Amaranthus hypochondriacus]